MTLLSNFQAFGYTDNDPSLISVTATTNSIVATTDTSHGNYEVAVKRILKAKNAKTNLAFTDGDEFLAWLHK